jgi:tRNA 2-thiouridine synthesizing protein E
MMTAMMQTNPYAIYNLSVTVEGKEILTDQEGYIQNMDEWSEAFVQALAAKEGLALTDEHWEVIHFIRDYQHDHGVQAPVRDMLKHFRQRRGLAGVRRTKGEH